MFDMRHCGCIGGCIGRAAVPGDILVGDCTSINVPTTSGFGSTKPIHHVVCEAFVISWYEVSRWTQHLLEVQEQVIRYG